MPCTKLSSMSCSVSYCKLNIIIVLTFECLSDNILNTYTIAFATKEYLDGIAKFLPNGIWEYVSFNSEGACIRFDL